MCSPQHCFLCCCLEQRANTRKREVVTRDRRHEQGCQELHYEVFACGIQKLAEESWTEDEKGGITMPVKKPVGSIQELPSIGRSSKHKRPLEKIQYARRRSKQRHMSPWENNKMGHHPEQSGISIHWVEAHRIEIRSLCSYLRLWLPICSPFILSLHLELRLRLCSRRDKV